MTSPNRVVSELACTEREFRPVPRPGVIVSMISRLDSRGLRIRRLSSAISPSHLALRRYSPLRPAYSGSEIPQRRFQRPRSKSPRLIGGSDAMPVTVRSRCRPRRQRRNAGYQPVGIVRSMKCTSTRVHRHAQARVRIEVGLADLTLLHRHIPAHHRAQAVGTQPMHDVQHCWIQDRTHIPTP